MPRIRTLKARDLINVAKQLGFLYEGTQGSHFIFRRPTDRKHLSIPVHRGRDIGRGITKAIIKQMGITFEEFLKLL